MNNLLKTLSESKVKTLPDVDLKLLLSTVKDGRGRRDDTALSNAFYESLESVLTDLKTVTLDNHDADAFLKPVLKAEVADYYDVISNPMDFQTMGKKLKAKQYKSKKEFKDDLDLIWSNCSTYNSTEGHHLPKAAARLKAKAERLLANVTDRKERTDPHIPPEFSSPSGIHPKINGINGRAHTRSPSVSSSSKSSIITIKPSLAKTKLSRRNAAFEDSLALVRTPEGMSMFQDLDRNLQAGASSAAGSRIREIISPEHEDEYDSESASLGDKRKVNGLNDIRAHKRARFSTPLHVPDSHSSDSPATNDDELTQMWWHAVQSDALLPNGLPEIPFPSSSSSHPFMKSPPAKSISQSPKKKKRRKKHLEPYRPETRPKSMLTLMNNNVRTIKRVRHTHARFSALGLAKDSGGANEDGEGAETALNPIASGSGLGADPMDVEEAIDDRVDERPWMVPSSRGRNLSGIEIGSENAENCVRWMNGKVLEHAGFQGTSKAALDVLSGVASEYLLNVGRTIKFLCDKFANTMSAEEIILHTLFESGISEIQDLERYVADDVERYGSRLADLEKKLVGAYREVTSVETLEDEGLFDDEEEDETSALALGEFADTLGVDYFGLRELGIADEFGMQSLTIPKRLLKGKKKRENLLPVTKPTEPPPPFPPPPPFIPLTAGQIPEQIGLLHKFYQDRLQTVVPPPYLPAVPTFYPPSLPGPSLGNPYPIPALPKPTIPGLPGPSGLPELPPSTSIRGISSSLSSQPQPPHTQPQLATALAPPETIVPDDSPTPVQAKMGPLGQIVKTGSSYPAAKKKTKAATAASTSNVNPSNNTSNSNGPPSATPNPPSAGGINGIVKSPVEIGAVGDTGTNGVDPRPGDPSNGSSPGPKKKKGATGVGSGNGRKKRLLEAGAGSGLAQAQAQAHAHPSQNPSQGHGQDPRPPSFPPVVAASA